MSSLGTRSTAVDSTAINAALFPHYQIPASKLLSAQKHNYIMVDFINKNQYTTGESVGNPGIKKHVYLKKGNFKKNTKTQILYSIPQADITKLEADNGIAKCIVLTKLQDDGKYKMANDDAYKSINKSSIKTAPGAKQGNHSYIYPNYVEAVGTGHFMVEFTKKALVDAGKYRLYYTDLLTTGMSGNGLAELKAKEFGSSDPYVDIGVGLEHAVPDPIILKIKNDDAEDIELEKYWAIPTNASIKADVNAAYMILDKDHIVVFNTTDTQKNSIKELTVKDVQDKVIEISGKNIYGSFPLTLVELKKLEKTLTFKSIKDDGTYVIDQVDGYGNIKSKGSVNIITVPAGVWLTKYAAMVAEGRLDKVVTALVTDAATGSKDKIGLHFLPKDTNTGVLPTGVDATTAWVWTDFTKKPVFTEVAYKYTPVEAATGFIVLSMYASDDGLYDPDFSNIKIGSANMELGKQTITMTGLPLVIEQDEAATTGSLRTRSTHTDSAAINAALFPHYEISTDQSHNYIMVDFRNKHQYTTGESVGNPGKKNDVYLKKGNFKKNTKTQILYYIPQKDIEELKGLGEDLEIQKCIVLTKLKDGKYKMANDDAYKSIKQFDVETVPGAKQGNHVYVGPDMNPVATGHFMVEFTKKAVVDAGKYRLYYTDLLKPGMGTLETGLAELKAKEFGSSDPYVDIGVGLEHAVPDPIILNIKDVDAEDIELEKYWAKPVDASIKAEVNAANIILGEDHIVVFNTTDTQKNSIKDNKPKPKTGHLLIGKYDGGNWVREDKDNNYGDLYYSLFTTEWQTRLNDGVFLWDKEYIKKEFFKMYYDSTNNSSISKNTHKFFYVPKQENTNGSKVTAMSGDNIYGSVPLTLIDAKLESTKSLPIEAAAPAPAPAASAPTGFKVGDTVLYKTHNAAGNKRILNVDLKWTPSKIVAVNDDGTYNLRQVPVPQTYLGPLFNSYYPNRPNRTPDEVIKAAKEDTVVNPEGVESFSLRSNVPKAEIQKPSDISNWQERCNDVTPPASRSAKSSIDEKLDALIYIQSELISLLKKKLL